MHQIDFPADPVLLHMHFTQPEQFKKRHEHGHDFFPGGRLAECFFKANSPRIPKLFQQ